LNQIPNGLFAAGLDEVASLWLKKAVQKNKNQMRADVAYEMLRVAEALIISPRVTFRVYGENVVLSLLIKFFGKVKVRELIESCAIDFVLWNPTITYTDDQRILTQGVCPIQSGVLTSAPHSDPLVSASTGLEGWCPEVPIGEKAGLAKLAASKTFLPPGDLSHKAVGLIVEAYQTGMLSAEGFDSTVEINKIDAPRRRRLAHLAERTAEACILLDRDLDVLENKDTWESLWTIIATLKSRGAIRDAVQEILKLERLPSIPSLILSGLITWDDVIAIRERSETQEFRRWLWSQPDPRDIPRVSEEYLKALTPQADFRDGTWFKIARISTVSVIGGLIGTVAAGPVGGVAGAAVGIGLGSCVSLADGLFVDRLMHKPNPRRFATDVLAAPMIIKGAVANAPGVAD
jgi:hypothetical protein